MPDAEIGTAHGQVEFTADLSGLAEASAGMDALGVQAEGLSASLDDNVEHLDKHNESMRGNATTTQNLASQQEGLRARLKEASVATADAERAEAQYRNTLLSVHSTTEEIRESQNAANNARREAVRADKDAEASARALRVELDKANASNSSFFGRKYKLDTEVDEAIRNLGAFDKAKDRTRENVRGLDKDLKNVGTTLKDFVKVETAVQALGHLTSAITEVRNAGLGALAIGSLAGGAGLLGGGGAEGISAIVGSMTQLVGLVGLLPGLLAGAGASAATLLVSFHGISESLSAMASDDPQAFVKSLREISPLAREAMVDIQGFWSSFKGAMFQVQDSFFRPLLADIDPLVQTYLPMLMQAGDGIANAFGQAGHLFVTWLEVPSTVQTINQFLGSVISGLQAALPAVTAFSNAFLTISTVGGGFFKEIGSAIANAANEFNVFISGAAQDGKLRDFIQYGISAFTVLAHNIKDVVEGLFNIFSIGNQFGGGFLAMFKDIGDEFLSWTQSTKGQNSIAAFFSEITQAGAVLHPILTEVFHAFETVASTLVKLGIAIGPGLTTFFGDLSSALKTIGPELDSAAPAFNLFLDSIGKLLLNIGGDIAGNLPDFLASFAQAATNLVTPLSLVAEAVTDLLGGLTPSEIEALTGFVFVLSAASKAAGILRLAMLVLNIALTDNPIGIVVEALAAVAAGLTYAYNNSEQFRNAINELWQGLKDLYDGNFDEAFDKIGDALSKVGDEAFDWGKNLVQNFINGMKSLITDVDQTAFDIVATIERKMGIHSPAAEGPLSEDASIWGSNLVQNFADGMNSSQGSVSDAATGTAGAASGIQDQTTFAGQSAGAYGRTNYDDGFTQYVKGLTSDLSAWVDILKGGTDLFKNIANDIVKPNGVIDTFARLLNGGNNDLTKPGGIDAGAKPFIPQDQLSGQKDVAGVPKAGPAGKYSPGPDTPAAELPKGIGQGATPDTVPPSSAPGAGIATTSGTAGTGGLSADQGNAPNPPPSSQAPSAGDTPLTAALKQKGFSPAEIRLIQGFSQREGLNPAGNPTLGWTDAQLGGDSSLQGHVDALAKQFKDRQGQTGPQGNVIGAFPESGSDQDQANWIADVVGQNGSTSDWQKNAQPTRQNYVNSIIAGMGAPLTGGGQQSPAPAPNGGSGNDSATDNFSGDTSGPSGVNVGSGASSNRGLVGGAAGIVGLLGAKRLTSLISQYRALGPAANAVNAVKSVDPSAGSPLDLNGLNVDLGQSGPSREVYHVTDEAGAKGILNGGFQDLPGRQSYFSKDIRDAQANLGIYGDRVIAGTVPDSAFDPDFISGAVRAPASNLQGIQWQQLTPEEIASRAASRGITAPPNGGGIRGQLGQSFAANRDNIIASMNAGSAPEAGAADAAAGTGIGLRNLGRGLGLTAFAGMAEQGTPINGLDIDNQPATRFPDNDTNTFDSFLGTAPTQGGDAAFNPGPRAQISLGGAPGAEAERRGRSAPLVQTPVALADQQSNLNTTPTGPTTVNGFPQLQPGQTTTGAFGSQLAPGPAETILSNFAQWFNTNIEKVTDTSSFRTPAPGSKDASIRSNHLSGTALDLNPNDFPGFSGGQSSGAGAETHFTPDQVAAIRTQLATYNGAIYWGQDFGGKDTDPMHFELSGAGYSGAKQGGPQNPAVQAAYNRILAQNAGGPGQPPEGGGIAAVSGQAGTGPYRVGEGQQSPPASPNGGTNQPGALPYNTPVVGNAAGLTGVQQYLGQGPTVPKADTNQKQPFGASNALGTASQVIGGVGGAADDIFSSIQSVIASISAGADLLDKAARIPKDTETVVSMIKDVQQFISTGAQIAKTVSDISGTAAQLAGGAGGADMGIASGALSAVSAISGLVSDGLEAVNQGITLGIEVYHEIGKYVADIGGYTLGGAATGWLGGNVNELLNTNTGQLYTYNDDNPLNKNTLTPGFRNAYTNTNAAQQLTPTIGAFNIYAGPGQTTQQMMSDSMWMVGTGGASVASVAGHQ